MSEAKDFLEMVREKRRKVRRMEEALAGKLPPGKPDIDNILKVVLDGLNGIAYKDDKQVVLTQCKKVYADTTRPAGLQVNVIPMDNANGYY